MSVRVTKTKKPPQTKTQKPPQTKTKKPKMARVKQTARRKDGTVVNRQEMAAACKRVVIEEFTPPASPPSLLVLSSKLSSLEEPIVYVVRHDRIPPVVAKYLPPCGPDVIQLVDRDTPQRSETWWPDSVGEEEEEELRSVCTTLPFVQVPLTAPPTIGWILKIVRQ